MLYFNYELTDNKFYIEKVRYLKELKTIIMRYVFIFFIQLVFIQLVDGQNNNEAILKGNVQFASKIPELELTGDEAWLKGKSYKLKTPVDDDGAFFFTIPLDRLTLFTLSVGQKRLLVFLEPGDFLELNVNPYEITKAKFEGKGADKNTIYHQYNRDIQMETNPFRYKRYKKGELWFAVSPMHEMDMMANSGSAMLLKMEGDKQDAWMSFNNLKQEKSISPAFESFMKTEIEYHYAFKVLSYHMIYKSMHSLDNNYLDVLEKYKTVVDSNQMNNHWFRNFHLHAVNYDFILEKKNYKPQFDALTDYVEKKDSSITRNFILSELLNAYVNKYGPDEYLGFYRNFITDSVTQDYQQKVSNTVTSKLVGWYGQPAPKFKFLNIENEAVILSDIVGDQKILINFWATWCQPCLKKIPEFKKLSLPSDVKIIHLSLDRKKEDWESYVKRHNIPGEHVWAYDDKNETYLNQFKISSLPSMSLINQYGNFSKLPDSENLTELISLIR